MAVTKRFSNLTRAEKSLRIKEDLFHAAAKVVGEVGYSGAMVSKITAAANVAQGTFYNHFESQQDLFDQLLPALGSELLQFLKVESSGATNALERERLSFNGFFQFLKLKPEFYRILYEAELFAPRAFQTHMRKVADAYVRTIQREAEKGEIEISGREEAEAIVYMLMGLRHYLCMRFARRDDGQMMDPPEWIVDTYLRTVSKGLFKKRRRSK